MHTLKLKIQDSVFDKIMYFLHNLPKNEVEVIMEKVTLEDKEDFIAHLSSNPITIDDTFLTRTIANER